METILMITAVVLTVVVVGLVVVLVVMVRRRPGAADGLGPAIDDLTGRMTSERTALETRLDLLGRSVSEIQTAIDRREGAIEERMGRIGEQVTDVVALFTSDRRRGSWGEFSLRRVFEVVGLVEGRDYENQFHEGDRRPDVVVTLPGERRIVIDSKFPVARYQEAMALEDAEKRRAKLVAHGRELERVGKELATKHYSKTATGGYVVIYVPSQAVYEAAIDANPDLLERLMRIGVIVAGPAAVFALLKTVGTLLAEHRAVSEARAIVDDVRDLRDRFRVFTGHLARVGNGLSTAVSAFNGAVGSWNGRVNPALDRIADKSGEDSLEPIEALEEPIRETPIALRPVG
jgi:DNA recombination protein RmuC